LSIKGMVMIDSGREPIPVCPDEPSHPGTNLVGGVPEPTPAG
jgi:hypothetical protein